MGSLILELMTFIEIVTCQMPDRPCLKAPQWQPVIHQVSAENLFYIHRGQGAQYAGTTNFIPYALYFNEFIYLKTNWSRENPGDLSAMVHELTHYMQEQNGISYKCEGDRERLAYEVQEAFLKERFNGMSVYEATGTHILVQIGHMWCDQPNLAKPWEPGY